MRDPSHGHARSRFTESRDCYATEFARKALKTFAPKPRKVGKKQESQMQGLKGVKKHSSFTPLYC